LALCRPVLLGVATALIVTDGGVCVRVKTTIHLRPG
jgi:hypothetical protein